VSAKPNETFSFSFTFPIGWMRVTLVGRSTSLAAAEEIRATQANTAVEPFIVKVVLGRWLDVMVKIEGGGRRSIKSRDQGKDVS
jgi:hypothetical protein